MAKLPKLPKNYKEILLISCLVSAVIITGAGLGFITASIQTMPSLKGEIKPSASSQVYDVKGRLIANVHATENRVPVPLNKIPAHLQNAFIAVEDAQFYKHRGISLRGILRAMWANITGLGVHEGASTITQQLARNAFLTQDRTLKRKIQEMILAIKLERYYTKQEILELYLNQIYFGQGAYGVQAAANLYFGKDVDKLSLAESAMLAGIPQSPNYYSPLNNFKAAKERQALVLGQMHKYGFITAEEAQAAKEATIKLQSKAPQGGFASYFVEYITQQLIERYGADAVYKEGLQVYTSLDIDMQQTAEKAMAQLPDFQTDANGLKQPQGALVAIDPRNGYIKAMVGGRGTDKFNRAVQAERQPGSAFKPFVYLAALESGFTPASIVEDSKVKYEDWEPKNYKEKFSGDVTLRYALEQSLNVPTVKLLDQVGIDKVIRYAQQMGITTLVTKGKVNDRNLGLGLGGLARGVTPLELASAFGTLANQGVRAEPIAILKVVDREGRVLEQRAPKEKAVINERVAYLLTNMLRGVIERGTGTVAYIGRPAAGKTGTTSDYKDAWFVGYTPDLVAAVWMGFDTATDMGGITGGSIPAAIWRDFMREALKNTPPRDFVRPPGIVGPILISGRDGLLADDKFGPDAYGELFLEGTQPTKYSTIPKDIKICSESKQLATSYCPPDKIKAPARDEPLPKDSCALHPPKDVKDPAKDPKAKPPAKPGKPDKKSPPAQPADSGQPATGTPDSSQPGTSEPALPPGTTMNPPAEQPAPTAPASPAVPTPPPPAPPQEQQPHTAPSGEDTKPGA